MLYSKEGNEVITSISLYRDEKAEEQDYNMALQKLISAFPYQKDTNFWALALAELRKQNMTKQQLSDTIDNAVAQEFPSIKALRHDKKVRMYSKEQMLKWFNDHCTPSSINHNLLYFYIYPQKANGETFYCLWSDLAKEGVNIEPLKVKQAKEFNY